MTTDKELEDASQRIETELSLHKDMSLSEIVKKIAEAKTSLGNKKIPGALQKKILERFEKAQQEVSFSIKNFALGLLRSKQKEFKDGYRITSFMRKKGKKGVAVRDSKGRFVAWGIFKENKVDMEGT